MNKKGLWQRGVLNKCIVIAITVSSREGREPEKQGNNQGLDLSWCSITRASKTLHVSRYDFTINFPSFKIHWSSTDRCVYLKCMVPGNNLLRPKKGFVKLCYNTRKKKATEYRSDFDLTLGLSDCIYLFVIPSHKEFLYDLFSFPQSTLLPSKTNPILYWSVFHSYRWAHPRLQRKSH